MWQKIPKFKGAEYFRKALYKSMLDKSPTYLSSLVTIATPTRSMHSSRYSSLVIPKAITSFGCLSFQFSAANDWNELQKSLKLESYISLTLSISCQSNLQITTPVHSPSVNSPSNYLIPILLFFLFVPLHPSISTCSSSSAHLSLQC